MKPILNAIIAAALFSASTQLVLAQEVAAHVGFGSGHDSSSGAPIETYSDGILYKTGSLGGVFAHAGFDVFFGKTLGVGAEISWRVAQADYAGVSYRPGFYNVDVIYRPAKFKTKRWDPELRAGLGGARLRFSPSDDQSCAQVPGCEESNHFQQHLAVAARWSWTDHWFLRPAFDLHHVNNFSEFGSNWVPEYSVGVGYSVGKPER